MKKKNSIIKSLTYLVAVLIPYQIYFNLYKDKNVTLFMVVVVVLFLIKHSFRLIPELFRPKMLFYTLFMASISISVFYSSDKFDAVKHVFFLGLGIIVFLTYRNSTKEKEKVLEICSIASFPIAILIIFLSLFEQYEFAVVSNPVMCMFIEPDTLFEHIFNIAQGALVMKNRVGGVFLNAQVAALFAGLNITVSVWLYIRKKKLFFLFIFVFWIWALVATGARSGVGAAIIVTSIMLILFVYRKYKKIVYVFILILALAAIGSISVNHIQKLNPRLGGMFIGDGSYNGRLEIWSNSLKVIKNNYLFGVGLDAENWNNEYNKYVNLSYLSYNCNLPPHNMFLFIWGKSGIFALLFIMLFFTINIAKYAKYYLEGGSSYNLVVLSSLLWIFIVGMTENMVLMEIRILSFFWLVFAFGQENKISLTEKE